MKKSKIIVIVLCVLLAGGVFFAGQHLFAADDDTIIDDLIRSGNTDLSVELKLTWTKNGEAKERVYVCDPALLAKYLMETKAEWVVAVHNHPVGTPFSSEYDDEATSKMQVVCSIQNVLLCDHIIFAGGDVYSYYQSGKMKKISNDYSLTNLFKQEKGE